MSDLPAKVIAQIAALKLPPKTEVEILRIIATLVGGGTKKGTALPEDWEPSESDVEYGLSHGLTLSTIDTVAERMRLWGGANSNRAIARKAGTRGWSLTFKGFLLREAKERRNRGGALDVVMELEEQARPLNGANGHGRRKRNGAPSGDGLLSFGFSAGHTGGPERD